MVEFTFKKFSQKTINNGGFKIFADSGILICMESTASIFSITPFFMWGMFVFVSGLWAIATLVLNYHWKTYDIPESKTALIKYAYLVGSSFFLVVLFLSALTFSLS
jgi:hypothetical protein